MLSILSLLSFAVIAACSNVTIEFELTLDDISKCSTGSIANQSVTFCVLYCTQDQYYCHIHKGKFKL